MITLACHLRKTLFSSSPGDNKGLNPRQTAILLLFFGLLAVAGLTALPYTLHVVEAVHALAPAPNIDEGPAEKTREANKIIVSAAPSMDAAEWFLARGEEPEKHGVLVETSDRKRTLASLNADTEFNPASVTKLATSLIALKELGPDYRFETKVFATGGVDAKGTLQGALQITGGDPTFGDLGASFLAKELRVRGVKRVRDGLSVSPSFSFNHGGAEESATRLAKSLGVGALSARVVPDAPTGQLLFVFKSNTLREVLLYMNAHSNNFVAEGVGALVGGPEGIRRFLIDDVGISPEQVSIEAASGLGRNRLTPRGIVAVLRALLDETKRHQMQPEDVMPIVKTDWGTLRHRLEGTGLEYAVAAKTGTLTTIDGGMACLAGVVYTKDFGPVLFTILDHGNNVWSNRQMEDQLLSEIINNNSAPQPIAGPTPRPLLPSNGVSVESE